MAILKYYVGIVGSGKTTVARQALQEGELFLDSDEMREELFGDAACQDNPSLVFATMEKRTIEALNSGRNVIYVACNIWSRRRISFLNAIKKKAPGTVFECYVVVCPIEIARKRNSERSRVCPAYVIDRQLRQFEIPYEGEGWDSIKIIHNYNEEEGQEAYTNTLKRVHDFGDQKNEHHSLTLMEHCVNAYDYAINNNMPFAVRAAACCHDFGKAWTQEYWEKDGGKNAHYPNHANVGTILAVTSNLSLRALQLINYHMVPYMDEKAQATWRARLGEDFWKELMMLHEADAAAH